MELTPRLKLRKPAIVDPTEEEDYNYNYDILDNNPGWTICTSATRPVTNLYLRRMIYETDTKRVYAYSGTVGSEWIPVYPTPAAQMTRNAGGAALPVGPVWTTLDMDLTIFDNYGICDLAANSFKLPYTGLWYFSLYWIVNVGYPGNLIGARIMKETGLVTISDAHTATQNSATRGYTTFTDGFYKATKDDAVIAQGYNNYGAGISIVNGSWFIQFNAYFIGDQ